jgi:hypothetical protein
MSDQRWTDEDHARLRRYATISPDVSWAEFLGKAAAELDRRGAEIERLQRENEALKKQNDSWGVLDL